MAANEHKKLLDDLGAEVEQLKVRFMLYFQGIERQNPAGDRDLLKKALVNTRRDASRWNTGDRFRMNSIYNKFMSYDRMWSRTLTEMENGTFRNDKKRVERKRKAEEEAIRKAAGVPEMTAEEMAAVKRSVQAAARGQAANGGGGRGQAIVPSLDALDAAITKVNGEIAANAWDPGVMFERSPVRFFACM